MPRASIDIGSNSVVFLVLDDDGGIVYDDAEVVSLGKGLALNHAFLPDRMDAALQTIASYAEVATQHGVRPSDIRAIATSASRRAGNAETFYARVRSETGVSVRIISGIEEAELTWRGSLYGLTMPDAPMAVVDLGGGSTEVVVGRPGAPAPESRVSLEIGTVRLMEQFFDPQPADYLVSQFEEMSAHIAAVVSDVDWGDGPQSMVAVAGTATTLAAMNLGLEQWDRQKVHGSYLSISALEEWILSLLHSTPEQRRIWAEVSPKRADVLLAGAAVLHSLCAVSGVAGLTISDGGIRHGALIGD